MFIMGNMALLWGGYGIFSDLLILFGFPGLQTHYKGQNMQRILVKYEKKTQPNLSKSVYYGNYGCIRGRIWYFFRFAYSFKVSWPSSTIFRTKYAYDEG